MTAATGFVHTIDTPDGPFTFIVDDDAVLAAGWVGSVESLVGRIHPALRPAELRPVPIADGQATEAAAEMLTAPEVGAAAASAVAAYYVGDINAPLSVRVLTEGTALQQRGWEALRTIAPGEPLTYAQFAALIGSPQATRAAASICARNPAALFVPCHRVVRADGSLGGFAWGLEVKRALLERERAA